MQVAEAREQQFGAFQVVRELNQVGTAIIYSARDPSGNPGGPPDRAVKVIRMPSFVAPDEASRRIQAFMDRAQVQQRVAAAASGSDRGAGHWATIHEGPTRTPDGAFYASDLYARSCDALVDGRRGSLTGVELWAMARQVAAASG